MREWQSQSHVKWYCRDHVVIGLRPIDWREELRI
jgi:hypothetical protein